MRRSHNIINNNNQQPQRLYGHLGGHGRGPQQQNSFPGHQQQPPIQPGPQQQASQQPSPQQPTRQQFMNAQQPPPTFVDMPPVETVVARLETACRLLHGVGTNSTRIAEISSEIQILSDDLRLVGPHLEAAYPDVLDRVMSSMRDASAQPLLPKSLRLAIFEIVELRAAKWMLPSDSLHYYRQRRIVHEGKDANGEDDGDIGLGKINASPSSDLSLLAGDAKTYREEILIKNSDSGKVMGIRGRRVGSSAKERVLSINGYSQQSINMAKQLIQETINRNASPVFDSSPNSMVANSNANSQVISSPNSPVIDLVDMHSSYDAIGQSYTYTVTVNQDETIRLSGGNFHLVQEAKLALEDYFSSKYALPSYTRDELLDLRSSVRSNVKPDFTELDKVIVDAIVLDKSKCSVKKRSGKLQPSSNLKQATSPTDQESVSS